MRNATLALSLMLLPAPAPASAQVTEPSPWHGQRAPEERIYGRVLTTEGRWVEGYLRWDRNETQWADVLDGLKEIPPEHDREAERLDEDLRRRRQAERSLRLPGLLITWDEDDDAPRTVASGIRFGHVRTLEVLDEGRARLVLGSGAEVTLAARSTDLGGSLRGLVVEAGRGEVELRWRDLERVDFVRAPESAPAPSGDRLHGTVRTHAGVELTGWIAWDMDEALTTDVLDGDLEGRRRQIAFDSITAIRPEGRNAARVTLASGNEMVLSGTNDVNADHRGVEITDPALGRAVVPWAELERVRFHPRDSGDAGQAGEPATDGPHRAPALDGGRPLRGTVETRIGAHISGTIRWDNDETATWEMLDGIADGVDYDIELGLVRSIEREGMDAARVELIDGRVLLLERSNDVNEENQGIFVRTEGGVTTLVRWSELVKVTFEP